MTLRGVIDFVKSHEKDLLLCNVAESDLLVSDIRQHLDTQNVCVKTVQTASGTPQIAVLSDEDSVLAVEAISALRDALASGTADSTAPTGLTRTEIAPLFSHLKETTFTSYDNTELLYASREIEDRARRVGNGSLHAGFQRLSIMASQQQIYTDLARCGVDVHAYGIPDTDPPDFGTGQVHAIDSDEIAQSWFVVFDGGSDETQKTALIAQEAAPNSYFGAWTYDRQLVDQISLYLTQTYLSPDEGNASRQRDNQSGA